jgi:hypothetical protein
VPASSVTAIQPVLRICRISLTLIVGNVVPNCFLTGRKNGSPGAAKEELT